jgi:hypothetical protein
MQSRQNQGLAGFFLQLSPLLVFMKNKFVSGLSFMISFAYGSLFCA